MLQASFFSFTDLISSGVLFLRRALAALSARAGSGGSFSPLHPHL